LALSYSPCAFSPPQRRPVQPDVFGRHRLGQDDRGRPQEGPAALPAPGRVLHPAQALRVPRRVPGLRRTYIVFKLGSVCIPATVFLPLSVCVCLCLSFSVCPCLPSACLCLSACVCMSACWYVFVWCLSVSLCLCLYVYVCVYRRPFVGVRLCPSTCICS
jgi:hypothetical protein